MWALADRFIMIIATFLILGLLSFFQGSAVTQTVLGGLSTVADFLHSKSAKNNEN